MARGDVMPHRDWNGRTTALLMALALAAPAGCASSQTGPLAGLNTRGPIDTGTYPNLNVPPESAAAPITTEDRAALDGSIGAARRTLAANGGATAPQSDQAYLKKLAADHGKDTLAEIEAN
jgi:hypothetical protein